MKIFELSKEVIHKVIEILITIIDSVIDLFSIKKEV